MTLLPHAKAEASAVHSLTMGDLTHAVINELASDVGLNPLAIDPDETVLHLDTTAFNLTITFGRVARRLGLIES